MTTRSVSVVGAGGWGTALALVAHGAGNRVTLAARSDAKAGELREAGTNARYLPGIALPHDLVVTADLATVADSDIVVLAVPAQASRVALEAIGNEALEGKIVVLTAKGLETGTRKRQSEILTQIAPNADHAVLSGPSFAVDVAAQKPTAVTVAALDPELAEGVCRVFAGPAFRPYAASDPQGVELAGALKNVFAIACGAVEGAGLGLSARSAVLARGFAEFSRLVSALGGAPATLTGLAGLGDLVLSCTSTKSRNFSLGVALAHGETSVEGTAEGAHSAPVALEMAQAAGIDVPIVAAVNALLAGRADIGTLVNELMARPLRREDGET